MKRIIRTALAAMLVSSPTLAYHPGDNGAVTMTRYVLQFGKLERELIAAQAQQDEPKLEAMLAPAFEVRKASGEVIVRRDWIARAKSLVDADAVPTQLVVYEIGAYAVANFRLAKPGVAGGSFVTDIWVPIADGWQLRARTESIVPTTSQ